MDKNTFYSNADLEVGKKTSFISLYEQAGSVFSNTKSMKRPISLKAGQILDSFGWKGFDESNSSFLYIYNDYNVRPSIQIRKISGDIEAEELFTVDGETMYALYGTKGEIEIKSVHDNDGYECEGFEGVMDEYPNPMRLFVDCSVSDTYSFEEYIYPAQFHMKVVEPDDEISALVCETTVMIYNDQPTTVNPDDIITLENRDIAFICHTNAYPNRNRRSNNEPEEGPYTFDGWYDAVTGKLVSTSPVYIISHPTHSLSLKPKARLAKVCTVKLTAGENIQGVRVYETNGDGEKPDFSNNVTYECIEGTNLTIEAKYGRDYSFGKWTTSDGKTFSITDYNEIVVTDDFQMTATAIDMDGKCIVRVNTHNSVLGFPWEQYAVFYVNGKITIEDDHKESKETEKKDGTPAVKNVSEDEATARKQTYTAIKNYDLRSQAEPSNTLGKSFSPNMNMPVQDRFGNTKKTPEEVVNRIIARLDKERGKRPSNENNKQLKKDGLQLIDGNAIDKDTNELTLLEGDYIYQIPYVTLYPVVEPMGTVKYSDGNGTTEGTMHSHVYDRNTERVITLVAKPNKGYKFMGWYYSEHQDIISTDTTLKFKVTHRGKRKTISAMFVKDDVDFLMLKANTTDTENTAIEMHDYSNNDGYNQSYSAFAFDYFNNVKIVWEFEAFYRYFGNYPIIAFYTYSREQSKSGDRFMFREWKGVEGISNWYNYESDYDYAAGLYLASKYDLDVIADWENIGDKKIVESYVRNLDEKSESDYAATVTGTGLYNIGDEVTVTVRPTAGYRFVKMEVWSYTDEDDILIYDGFEPTATFIVTDDVDVVVYVGYEDSIFIIGECNEGGHVSFYGHPSDFSNAYVYASADDGYRFLRWEWPVEYSPYVKNIYDDGQSYGDFYWCNETGVWTGGDVHIRAIFGPVDADYVRVKSYREDERYGYDTMGIGYYEVGSEATLNTYVNTEKSEEFVAYIDKTNEHVISLNNPFTFTVSDEGVTLFSHVSNPDKLSLIAEPVDGVMYRLNGNDYTYIIMGIPSGTEFYLEAVVDEYHGFNGWEYSEEWANYIQEEGNLITLTIPDNLPTVNLRVKALVSPKRTNVSVDSSEAQSMNFNVTGGGEVEYGSQATVSISPANNDQGEFIAWTNDSEGEMPVETMGPRGAKAGNEREGKMQDCAFTTTYTFTVYGKTHVKPIINKTNSGMIMYTVESVAPLEIASNIMYRANVSGNCFGSLNDGQGQFVALPDYSDKLTGKTYSFDGWTVTSLMPVQYNEDGVNLMIEEAYATVHIKANYKEKGDMVKLNIVAEPYEGGLVYYEGADKPAPQLTAIVPCNSEVKIGCTKNKGYVFKQWVDGKGLVIGNEESIQYIAKESTTIRAQFNPEGGEDVTLTVQWGEGGYVMIDGDKVSSVTVKQGTSVELEAFPNEGYDFIGWYDDSEMFSKENLITYTVNKTTIITASFTKDK